MHGATYYTPPLGRQNHPAAVTNFFMMNNDSSIPGIILAGGLAKRMGGGDKCLLPLGGKTLLQRCVERAQPQTQPLLLNANGSSLRFARTRLPVIADLISSFPGPLAGIHAGLVYMSEHQPACEWLASFACDTPFFPLDLVSRLQQAAQDQDAQIIVARCDGRVHPIFGLWHVSLAAHIEQLLAQGKSPRIQEWIATQKTVYVDFVSADYDPFFNINTPQDLYTAEAQLSLVK